MSKHIYTNNGAKFVLVPLLTADGEVDVAAMQDRCGEIAAEVGAQIKTDFDSVLAEVNAFLLANPNLKSVSQDTLRRSLWERRIEAGQYAGKSQEERTADSDRLTEVLANLISSSPNRFYVGKKSGVCIRYVDGENKPRHTDEQWAAFMAAREESLAKRAAKVAEKTAA